ncbi:MAG: P1 family peptidase, partial [Merdibacter sp.]|nr:P1 family peptidase [Merdibacter sp.]
HGIMLSGGSAFGLDAAAGAMRWLEENGCGFAIADQHVPIVCGASLFDLCVGDGSVRPDAAMGYEACKASERGLFQEGNYGAGTGASVGKLLRPEYAMKSGQGMAGIQSGSLQVVAIVAVNACGNVYDPDTGRALAGVYDGGNIADPLTIFDQMADDVRDLPQGNTTIGCVITNARLSKAQCNKIASITHNAYARTIFPVHTMSDGDTVFVMSTGECDAMPDAVGAFAVQAMSQAIVRAITHAEAAYGLPSCQSIHRIPQERK